MMELLQTLLILFLLVLTGLTAASEIAVVAVNRIRMRRLASTGNKPAKMVLKILETPERFFSTILIANNVVNTLIASLTTALMISLIGEANGIIMATVIVSLATIICEIIAKTFAAFSANKLSLALAQPLQVLLGIFGPIVRILARATRAILHIFGADMKKESLVTTEDELRTLITIGGEEGVLQKEKYKMLSKVFEFSDIVVRNVMTPKDEVVSICAKTNFDDVLAKVLETGFSRFPVYRDDPATIVGIVNMKDLLNLTCNRELILLQDVIYPATFVSEYKKVSDLLKEFQKGHTHVAIVIDNEGKMEGIVTLEDLLEEIVGEIEDEHDVRTRIRQKR